MVILARYEGNSIVLLTYIHTELILEVLSDLKSDGQTETQRSKIPSPWAHD